MKTRIETPTVTELRDLMSRQLRGVASELKAKEVKIDAAFMDKLSLAAKFYSLLSETVNADKIEEMIELAAFNEAMQSIEMVYATIESGSVETNIKTIDDLLARYSEIIELGYLDGLDEEELPDDIELRLRGIVDDYKDSLKNSEVVSTVNLVMKVTSSVYNSFAHSKDTMEDTANWFVKKSANLVNKVADVIGQEESPERSSADIMLGLKESLRKRCSTKAEAPDLKVAEEE